MARIASVSVCVARVFRSSNVSRDAAGKARDYCLVKVAAADGTEGIGFATQAVRRGISSVAVEELLALLLIGKESTRLKGCGRNCIERPSCTAAPVVSCVASAFCDIALWDLNARQVGWPLHQFLCGSCVDGAVPAWAQAAATI